MTGKKEDDDTPTPAKTAKQAEAAPKPQDAAQADDVVVFGPDGAPFKCTRPAVPHGLTEGAQFNRTVNNPKTRASHAQRFVVVNGKAVPVVK